MILGSFITITVTVTHQSVLWKYTIQSVYSKPTEPIDVVNISPLAKFETSPSNTPDMDATNYATETTLFQYMDSIMTIKNKGIRVLYPSLETIWRQ